MESLEKAEIDRILGNIFKQYRVKNNLTQEQIAEKLNISVKYISRIENGIGGVKIETLIKYINVLGISPNTIFEKFITNKELKTEINLSSKISKLDEEKMKFISGVIDLL